MRDFIYKAKNDYDKLVVVERHPVSGLVVSVSYAGVVLPFSDRFVSVTDADKKLNKYEFNWNGYDTGAAVKDCPDSYGNALQGIVLAEKPINER